MADTCPTCGSPVESRVDPERLRLRKGLQKIAEMIDWSEPPAAPPLKPPTTEEPADEA